MEQMLLHGCLRHAEKFTTFLYFGALQLFFRCRAPKYKSMECGHMPGKALHFSKK
jgi:hypothetical protein